MSSYNKKYPLTKPEENINILNNVTTTKYRIGLIEDPDAESRWEGKDSYRAELVFGNLFLEATSGDDITARVSFDKEKIELKSGYNVSGRYPY